MRESLQIWLTAAARKIVVDWSAQVGFGIIENLEDLSIDEIIEQFDVTGEQVAFLLRRTASARNESGGW